ncbi:MAG: hypothetical protein HWE10_01385, partial [Gammaproteobacteria bacterium]|nr:hypothetical protein [Gammaproteobacteria bacterium]
LVVGDGETTSVTTKITLSGEAVTYPVIFNYEFKEADAFASSVPIDEGIFIIQSGTEGEVTIDNLETGLYKFVFTELSDADSNAKLASGVTQVQVSENTIPVIETALMSGDNKVTVVDEFATDVSLNVTVVDADRTNDNNVTVSINGEVVLPETLTMGTHSLPIDPAILGVGTHEVTVNVAEIATDEMYEVESSFFFSIADFLPTLDATDSDGDGIADIDEGFADSDGDGIADYLDDSSLQSNEQVIALGNDNAIIEVAEGLTLTIGETLKSIDKGQSSDASVTVEELEAAYGVEIDDSDVTEYVTPIIDFEVKGVVPGETIDLVIPLSNALPNNARYRKLQSDGTFVNFDTVGNNAIASAEKNELDVCPAMDANEDIREGDPLVWVDGLVEGNTCIKLSIVDGGANDADGKPNGVVVDPGVVVNVNSAPRISLSDSVLTVNEAATVMVTATGTDADGDALTYTWESLTDVDVEINDVNSAELSFVAPDVDEDTLLEFKVTVTDGLYTSSRVLEVNVVFVNNEPSVTASADNTLVDGDDLVTLSATADDLDGDMLTYSWTQVSGPTVALSATDVAEVTFTAPKVSEQTIMTFEVTVSDGELSSASEVSVTVAAEPEEDEGLFGLSFGGYLIYALAGLVGLRRRRK